jgi:TRAP-type C4-dicarboxylate transport system substrate-binding protein
MLKTLVAVGSASAMLFFGSVVQAQTKWDMPTGYPGSNFHTENIRQFVGEVDKATSGKLKITVHDSGSLFKANEIKRAVQGGQADMGEVFISAFSNEDPMFGIDFIPFLASSYQEANKLWNASKKTIDARLSKQGLMLLYSSPWPPQGIFSNKPINSAADLKAVKMRAHNPATARIAQLVGAQAVTIQAAELPQALATGAVTAFWTSAATGYDSKAWEQVKYYYDVAAAIPNNLVIVSKKAFATLDKPTQDAVLKAAAAAEARGWKISQEKNAWYKEQLVKNGMKVEPGSDQLKSDLKKVGLTMTADWTTQSGAEGQAIIDAYRK